MATHEAPHVVSRAESSTERLASGLAALGIDASDVQRRQLLDFLTLLAKWNGVYNLTSVRDPGDMLSVHLLDALSIVGLVDGLGGGSLLDVGSGAGIPAIPLAIMRPTLEVRSIDAVAKKIGFQMQAKSTLKLLNLQPTHARVEAVRLPAAPSIVVSRAYADIPTMLESIDHLVDEGTTVIAMKGKPPTGELASLPSTWVVRTIEILDVPFLGAERCAVLLNRASASRQS